MMPTAPCAQKRSAGFTLVEMVVVIVLTGIVASMVAVFIRSPVVAYVDTERRARLTEAADTAMRYFARDVRSALPNSLRVGVDAAGVQYLEFVPTTGGARYRQYQTATNTGDILDFTTADTAFDLLGPTPAFGPGNSVVVFNLEPGSVSDVYSGNNRVAVNNSRLEAFSTDGASARVTVNLVAGTRFPAPSPSARVHFVNTPVTYACNLAAGQLRRYTGYAFSAAQPTPPAGAFNVLADNVTGCFFTYDPAVTAMRTGLVVLSLTLAQSGEAVQLVHQVHVQNTP